MATPLELTGIEAVNDNEAYKIRVSDKDGVKSTDYYDIKSGLKLRSIIVQEANGQTITQTMDFGDYKPVGGVQYPHSLTISGAGMPMPLALKATSVKINSDIDQSVFKIE